MWATRTSLAGRRSPKVGFTCNRPRSNGSWPGPRWGGGPDGGLKHENLEKSIAAVACAAIRSWRALDPAAADAALARGEDYLLDDSKVVRGDEVAWVYADGYRLFHFARRLPVRPQR